MNETEFIFYTIGFFGVGYSLAHLFKTMAITWQENPLYVIFFGIPAFILVISSTVILENISSIIIQLAFLFGFIFRFIKDEF